MNLALHEKQNPVWLKLREHLTQRLESLRAQNDGDLDGEQTAKVRGRIAEVKALLELEKEKPIIP